MKLSSIVGPFLFEGDIKKILLVAMIHKLQSNYLQTLRKSDTNNRTALITIPINIGVNNFTQLAPLAHRGIVQQSFIHHPYVPTIS